MTNDRSAGPRDLAALCRREISALSDRARPGQVLSGGNVGGAGRVKVGPDLPVPGYPEIFVVGDTTLVSDQPGIPGTAPPAKQMGRYVGGLIAARVTDGPTPPPFRYRHMGDLATIGRNAAVVKLGRLELTGFLGWLFWSAVRTKRPRRSIHR
jgi:NADH:ubiquinone reductase (H+-translocating)